MSFEINWDQLVTDEHITNSIKQFLDSQFRSIELPSFISNLSLSDFSLGNVPPEITIRHISDPFDEFYKDEEEEEGIGSGLNPGLNGGYDSSSSEEEDDDDVGNIQDHIPSDGFDGYNFNSSKNGKINGNNSTNNNSNSNTNNNTNNYGIKNGNNHYQSDQNQNLGESQYPFPKKLHLDATLATDFNRFGSIPMGRVNRSDSLPILNLGHHPQLGLHGGGSGADSVNNVGMGGVDPGTPLHYPYIRSFSSNPILAKGKDPVLEKSDNDIQFIMEFKYLGDIHLELTVELLVNYPLPNFITLPIKLHITDIMIHSILVVAYLKNSVFVSFLCDVNDTEFFANGTNSNGGNFVDYASFTGTARERIDIIKSIKIELEIGELEHNILRNVGKVERFLVEQLRGILREEVAWPSWLCFDIAKESNQEANED